MKVRKCHDMFLLYEHAILGFTLLHSEQPKLYGVLAILSTIGLSRKSREINIMK